MFRQTMIAALVFLCVLSTNTVAQDAAGPNIDRAWARATPGSATVGAAYFSIESATDDTLIGLASPVARKTELHTHIEQNGMMRMQALNGGLPLPAHQKLELKPGGPLHVMLIDLTAKLKPGDHFPLTMIFEKSGPRQVIVQVQPLGSMGPGDSTGMNKTHPPSAADKNQSTSDPSPHDSHADIGGIRS